MQAETEAAGGAGGNGTSDTAIVAQIAEKARQEAMMVIQQRIDMLMGALMLEAHQQLPGTAAAYWSLVSAATANDVKEMTSAAVSLGNKMGLRDSANLIGIATGSKHFMEDVRTMAAAASCQPRLAYGLIGMATGSADYLTAGAAPMSRAFGMASEDQFISTVMLIRTQLNDFGVFVPIASALEVSPDLLGGVMASAAGHQFSQYINSNEGFASSVGLPTKLVPTASALAELAHGDTSRAVELLKDDPAAADVLRTMELSQATDVHAFARLLQELTANPSFPRVKRIMDGEEDRSPTVAHVAAAFLSGSYAGASAIGLMVDLANKLSIPVHHFLAILIDITLQHVPVRVAKEVSELGSFFDQCQPLLESLKSPSHAASACGGIV
jgi:hypothetical protein